ncbi:putative bifunctional diguanylate cyclase/phosphodiesterase [Methylocella tundrae]|uniref:Diguanylate cyclase/phosphodiesterase with PAS/PAC sensor(S) (Modular protein) n=1 Tax=Methylocella tundrae TaxID=227605 RepID=A0A4U8Z3M7_METTU|nr:EAL domain-containing protein [Methylocella tundrae]WPP03775.1 EAL domain-containing protein [Methylocella tundrae]VFU09938.1 Diguanylate cyclase/phosphodiesterase with PAS/PAC sensor(S) (modular protein) [Methylocella tundrae]
MSAQATRREVDGGPVEQVAAGMRGDRRAAQGRALVSTARRPPEIETLHLAWRAAIVPPNVIPPYEELALGGLGRLADSAALIRVTAPGQLDILMAGPTIEAWIDQPSRRGAINPRSSGLLRAMHDAVMRALKKSYPAETVAHAVVDGLVRSYDLLALPVSNRWGPPLCQVYMKQREQRYNLVDAIFSATDEGVVALAAIRDETQAACDFEIVTLNDGAARLLKRGGVDLRGRRLSELLAEGGRNGALARFCGVVENGGSARFEIDAFLDAGADAHLSVNASAMGDLVAVTLTDISDIRARETSFRLLFDGSPTPTALCDPETFRFLAVNDAAAALWGFSREDLLTMTAFDVTPEEDWDDVRAFASRDPAGPVAQRIGRYMRSDRSQLDVIVHSRAIIFRDRHAHLITIIDVTEKQRAEVRLAHMAHHDALTDLPNRALFRQRLDEELARLDPEQGQLALFYLDLDQFKAINDTLGHPVGDALLRAVADRLRVCLRATDIVARFGGDEFGILRTGLAGPDEASSFASYVVDAVSRPFVIEGHSLEIGTSIGIAMAPGDGLSSDLLLKNADMALYRAKDGGRRAFHFFEPGMDARVRARRLLEIDLRRAMAAGEFELYYQPLVSLKSGAITGFEALLRWHHPSRGLVPPAEFIPLSEEIGLIVPLGEWVLRQACAEAARWPGHLKVAVNLSSVQFKTGNVTHAVLSALANSGLPASRLELEITESILLAESEANLATLYRLRGLGVSVSMDDFGTGYSSLSYLRAFPFDKIKIDRSFVSELSDGGDCMAIVRAVAGLGSSLGIATTAEGVETGEQLAWLRNEGCTEMQGYYFSPPVPASKIAPMLKANEGARSSCEGLVRH